MDELTRRRLAAFRARRLSWYALWLLVGLFVLSLFAEVLANSRPLVLHRQGRTYFPAFVDYDPAAFGQDFTFVVDWREVTAGLGPGAWALWPPVPWGPFESDAALARYPSPPDARHWLGTDDKGRDLLVRLLYGFRLSMVFALAVWGLSFAVGARTVTDWMSLSHMLHLSSAVAIAGIIALAVTVRVVRANDNS